MMMNATLRILSRHLMELNWMVLELLWSNATVEGSAMAVMMSATIVAAGVIGQGIAEVAVEEVGTIVIVITVIATVIAEEQGATFVMSMVIWLATAASVGAGVGAGAEAEAPDAAAGPPERTEAAVEALGKIPKMIMEPDPAHPLQMPTMKRERRGHAAALQPITNKLICA